MIAFAADAHLATATPAPVAAFDEVYRAHVGGVWRALSGLGVRSADVHDACQEVFVVVHRRLPEFDGRHKVSTWIHAICVKVALAFRRRASTRREVLVDEAPEAVAQGTPEQALDARQSMAALGRILDVLDDDKRAVFVLFEIEGLAMNDVAEAVGCPLQTAYSRLHAAREKVSQAMKRALLPTTPSPRRTP